MYKFIDHYYCFEQTAVVDRQPVEWLKVWFNMNILPMISDNMYKRFLNTLQPVLT